MPDYDSKARLTQVKERLAEINAKFAAAEFWGSWMAEMDKEYRALDLERKILETET